MQLVISIRASADSFMPNVACASPTQLAHNWYMPELTQSLIAENNAFLQLKSEIDSQPLKQKYETLKEENDNLKVQLTSSLVQARTFQQEVENIKHEMESGTQTIKFKINSTEFKTESGQHICVLCIGIALAGFIKRQTYGRVWKILFG